MTQRAGVMLQGQWLFQEIQQRLADIEERAQGADTDSR